MRSKSLVPVPKRRPIAEASTLALSIELMRRALRWSVITTTRTLTDAVRQRLPRGRRR